MLQPRRCGRAGGIVASYLLIFVFLVQSQIGNGDDPQADPNDGRGHLGIEKLSLDRIKRNSPEDITTVLLINNDDSGNGRATRPSGLLTSTARTFVNDGTTTEYGTQIIGTTLDNGRLYAQLLQTSSRVFYGGQERTASKVDDRVSFKNKFNQNFDNFINPSLLYDAIKPSEPVLIFPTKVDESLNLIKPEKLTQSQDQSFESSFLKSIQSVDEILGGKNGNVRIYPAQAKDDERELVENLIRSRKQDIFNKRNADGIKPTRATSNNLPTFTVRHDFAPSGVSVNANEPEKEETTVKSEKTKFRSGKGLPGKSAEKKFDTVTYVGFADFVTTVGNTVIVFMPNTKGASSVKSTSGTESITTKPVDAKVMTTVKTFMSHSPGMVTKTVPGHSLSMQTTLPTSVADRKSKGFGEDLEFKSSFLAKEQDAFEKAVTTSEISGSMSDVLIEPSETVTYSSISRTPQQTEPLPTFATTVTKSFNTGGNEKPLGLLKSIGGTRAYNGTTTHFTSLIYGTYVGNSYAQILKTSSSVFSVLDKTSTSGASIDATVVLDRLQTKLPELETTTEEDDELLTTEDDITTKSLSDTTTPKFIDTNDIDRARKIKSKPKVQELNADKANEILPTSTENLITRLVPSTAYKTFTYLTTFFIPAGDSTTTSIRSREVVTSDVHTVTKTINPNLFHTEAEKYSSSIVPTEVNAIDNTEVPDAEFRVPATRILAPEEIITTTEETETTETEETLTTDPVTEPESETTTNSPTNATTTSTTPIMIISSTSTTTEAPIEPLTTEKDREINSTTASSKEEDEEVEVIFKTLYTTYTYLTTFFQESTTSVSSRKVVVTNIITSTLDSSSESTSYPSLSVSPTSSLIKPTASVTDSSASVNSKIVDTSNVQISSSIEGEDQPATPTPELESSSVKTLYTTYTYFTTLFDNGSTDIISRTEVFSNIVTPVSVSVLPSSILANEELLKSKFEMLLREQQRIKSTIQPTTTEKTSGDITSTTTPSTTTTTTTTTTEESTKETDGRKDNDENNNKDTSNQRIIVRPTGTGRGRYGTIARKIKRPIKASTPAIELSASENDDNNAITRSTPKLDKHDRTVVRKRIRTKSRLLSPKSTTVDENLGITTIKLDPSPADEDKVVLETMVTDVTSSTSGGSRQKKRREPVPLEKTDKILDGIYADQISSESNTEEIEPSASPTILLQTLYTTFTYFTTLYKGSATGSSEVISRLETVTNVVTETVQPDVLVTPPINLEDATLPITYFTTFTYWTTLYKDGQTVITSREETVSNVVTPTISSTKTEPIVKTKIIEPSTVKDLPSLTTSSVETPTAPSVFVPGFVPGATPEPITDPPETESPITTKPIDNISEGAINKADLGAKFEPTTYYTTYTYFTTSYIGDSTVIKSRLETITNVVNATPTISDISDNDLQTGRAINSAANNQINKISDPKESSNNAQQTGLLSTVVSTSINDGKTTLYSTDVFGTFIDGIYAKVLESTTKIISEIDVSPTSTAEAQKTGVVSINEGRIVDADGISTTFFTTKAIGTSIEQLYAQVVESTSSVLVDNDKKSALANLQSDQSTDVFRTGLVRLIEGSIIKDGTTTHYESRVIGTLIDGRYAQIIESTSSFKIEPSVAPTATIKTDVQATALNTLSSASPSAIESSITDDKDKENEEEGKEVDTKGKGKIKSRPFQQRKKSFTPVIRPFSSRTRATFQPKKKTTGASIAQTITRASFTPTVTATPATKTEGYLPGSSRNRFGGRRSSSTVSEVKPTASTGGRRFSGRNRSTSTLASSSTISPSHTFSRRGTSARISPTPTQNFSSTRGKSNNLRASSTPGGSRPSLILPRPRIRPTLAGRNFQSTSVTSTTSAPKEEEDNLTAVTDENSAVTGEEQEDEEGSITTTTTTTTEDPRIAKRRNNPLFRLRKQNTVKTTTSPRPVATRKSTKSNKVTTTEAPTTSTTSTTTRTTRARPTSNYRPQSSRSRPGNFVFPVRRTTTTPEPEKVEPGNNEDIEEEDEGTENEDSNIQETAQQEVEEEEKKVERTGRGRSLSNYNSQRIVRSKRQAVEYGTRSRTDAYTYNSRYRRPPTRNTQAQDRYDYYYYDDEYVTPEAPKVTPASRSGRIYPSRSRQSTPVPSSAVQPRIRITPSSVQTTPRAPFTIREKDVTPNPRNTNFRRGQTQTSSRRKTTNYKATEPTILRKPTRGRTQSQVNDYNRSNQRRGYTTSRRPTTPRGRGRYDNNFEDSFTYVQPTFDGTITVTHKVPTEVTIPVISGKVTEYKNVITAKPSIEILGPHQYTVTNTNGGTLIFLSREMTATLTNGLTEVTRFLVHETPTTSITFTPATIRGRKTSFSHIVPSTVYDVENLVITIQPQLAANAPLANLLLSQLLLGNLNVPPNQGLGLNPITTSTPMPTTEYKTKTTTYVTSITDHTSTVLPITFRGKEILTTISDSSVNVITATEYITETIVITPTVNPNTQINSLLLPALLQAQLLNPNQQNSQMQNPILQNPIFQSPFGNGVTLEQLKLEALQQQGVKPEDIVDDKTKISKNNDIRGERESEEDLEEEKEEIKEQPKQKNRKKSDKKKVDAEPAKEVITLYVSGRRPGEFSTILSTVINGESSATVKKRETPLDDIERLLVEASEVKQVKVLASRVLSLDDKKEMKAESSYLDYYLTPGMSEVVIPVESREINAETQSLESVLGDVSKHVTKVSKIMPSSMTLVKPTQNNYNKNSKKHSVKSFLSKVPSEQ